MPHKGLSQIEMLIQNGQHLKAADRIKSFCKKNRLSKEDRLVVSDLWFRLGQLPKALKVLGGEGPTNQEIIIAQARILNQLGATSSAFRKIKDIKVSSSETELDQQRVLAEIYLTNYEFSQGHPFAETLVKKTQDPQSYRGQLDRILLADFLEGLGKWQEAVNLINQVLQESKPEQKVLKAICLQARAEYLIKAQQLSELGKIEADLNTSLELFTSENQTKDRAYALKWLGALKILQKNNVAAIPLLEESLVILQDSGSRATATVEVLYWLSQARALSFEESMLYQFYPIQSPWRENKEGNAVLIQDGKASSHDYFKMTRSSAVDFFAPRDLRSEELMLISLLLSSYPQGLSIYTLLDKIYSFDFVSVEVGIKRLEYLLQSVGKILSTKRQDNVITLVKVPDGFIFPKPAFCEQASYIWLKKMNCDFSVKDISRLLKVSESKAERLREEWQAASWLKL